MKGVHWLCAYSRSVRRLSAKYQKGIQVSKDFFSEQNHIGTRKGTGWDLQGFRRRQGRCCWPNIICLKKPLNCPQFNIFNKNVKSVQNFQTGLLGLGQIYENSSFEMLDITTTPAHWVIPIFNANANILHLFNLSKIEKNTLKHCAKTIPDGKI